MVVMGYGGTEMAACLCNVLDVLEEQLQAPALTATELTNTPNQDFGVWKNEGNGGEMEKNGGKWGGNAGKWRQMGGEWGVNGKMAVIAHGCGLWRVVARCGSGKWKENETKYPFFTVPFSLFSRRLKIFPSVPFGKISSPH